MPPPAILHDLVDRFRANLDSYKRGVYYTPTYIVDTIVKQTVGKLVEGKRPGPLGGVSKLRMLDLHKELAAEQVPHAKTVLQRQVEATDRQIETLVYELYGLTDAEIVIVEGG